MYGVIDAVVNGHSVFITSQEGKHYSNRDQFVFDKGHRCLFRGMELNFYSRHDVGKKLPLATSIHIINWEYPSTQVEAQVKKWVGRCGHAELLCGCRILLLRKNFLTQEQFINPHMRAGARLVLDVSAGTNEVTNGVTLIGKNIEILVSEEET